MSKYCASSAPLKVGLTGGIGSGKSIITTIFKTLEIPIYDADSNAKRLMMQNNALRAKLVATFGENTFTDEQLNTKYLAKIVFNNAKEIAKLNKLVHPAVGYDFIHWSYKYPHANYVIFEAAILFESGWDKHMDKSIVVDASEAIRISRVLKRDQTTREEVLKRIKNQWPTAKIKALADFIIQNNDKQLVLPQVIAIDKMLKN